MINPPIYRLTTAVSDIDQTNINRDIRDGNWLSSEELSELDQILGLNRSARLNGDIELWTS